MNPSAHSGWGQHLYTIADSLRPTLRQTQSELIVSFSEDVKVRSYPSQIAQLMTNLAMNRR